jgi:GT2 family glycosyltransferase
MSKYANEVFVIRNDEDNNLGVVGSYQEMYTITKHCDLLCYVHDDVIMREHRWDERVLKEFEDESVGLVGFGGAKWHGMEDLYKVPYKLQNLQRGEYLSNVDDAEVHGARFTDACDVAVLDGFCLIIRRDILSRLGGWSRIAVGCDFYCYDYALCALVRRLGYRVRVVGVRCHHRGGTTSVGRKSELKNTSQDAFEKSHRWFYEEFRDVMPCRVK